MTSLFTKDDYKLDRPKVLRAYLNNIIAYLSMQYPQYPHAEISAFAEQMLKDKVQRPVYRYIDFPSYGNAEEKKKDLLQFTNNVVGSSIITPSGTLYCTPDIKESLLKLKFVDNGKRRKQEKTAMFKAAEIGDTVAENRANLNQANIKIETNSMPGAMGSIYNVIYDLPGYNAVTAVARHGAMTGYSHVERLIEGNFHFNTINKIINYYTRLHMVCPKHVMEIVAKYNLHVPSERDFYDFIMESALWYLSEKEIGPRVESFIHSLPIASRTFCFYAMSLKPLIQHNNTFFRGFCQNFFNTDVFVDPSIESKEYRSIDSDLFSVVLSLNDDLIHLDEVKEVPIAMEQYPEGARKIVAIARHMERCLQNIEDIIKTFFVIDADIPDPMGHPKMIRKCVILSDTDSVIFTTKSMVEWYSGELNFKHTSYEINALTVYMISKTLEHIFARMSAGMGIVGKDNGLITMKNEYMYPLMMVTPLKKTYIGLIQIQEGKILPKSKLDMKGLSFRGSDISDEVNVSFKKFITRFFSDLQKDLYHYTPAGLINEVVAQEQMIYQATHTARQTRFFFPTSVKPKEEYDGDPFTTDYFYWLFWDKVFAHRYGSFDLPEKGLGASVVKNGKIFNSESYLGMLEEKDPETYKRLQAFKEEFPKKKITQILLPPTMPTIPDLIFPLIDIRKLIFENGRPYYLMMRAVGLGLGTSRTMLLFSDFYRPQTELLTI